MKTQSQHGDAVLPSFLLTRSYLMLRILCGHALHWHRAGLTLWCAWSRPCWFIGFFCSPHSLLPGIARWLVLVLGGCQACAWLPSARAFPGSLQALAGITAPSRFPPCTDTSWLSTGKSPCPCPFHAEGLMFQEMLSSELFSLFLNDSRCSSDHGDFCICTFSRGYLEFVRGQIGNLKSFEYIWI